MSNLKSQNQNVNSKSNTNYRSYQFSLGIINLLQTFPEKRLFWSIADQLLRSATSIGANITEAQASSSKRDFIRFFEIALKSANECRYWLSLVSDTKLIEGEKLSYLLQESLELGRMLGSSVLTLKGRKKESKFDI